MSSHHRPERRASHQQQMRRNDNDAESFQRTFKTYRIDLTPKKLIPEDSSKIGIPILGKWKKEQDIKSLRARRRNVSVLPEDGVAAMAHLWGAAIDSLENEVAVIGNSRLLVHFRDIFIWLQEQRVCPIANSVRLEFVDDSVSHLWFSSCGPNNTLSPNSAELLNRPLIDSETSTKAWVKRILVNLGICPFTKSVAKSGQGLGDVGVPVANIAYHHSNATSISELMKDSWDAMRDMVEAGPSGKDGVSSILLAAPFFDSDFALWAGEIFCLLETGVVVANAEKSLGVVCFHPKYETPDGSSFPGFGHMHSVPRLKKWMVEAGHDRYADSEIAAGGAWQRRTPHATINVLRAEQLEAAEKRRSSNNLYVMNIQKLLTVGSETLLRDLNADRDLGSST